MSLSINKKNAAILMLVFFSVFLISYSLKSDSADLISSRFSSLNIKLSDIHRVFPKCSDRDFWDKIDSEYAKNLYELGRKYVDYDPSYILPSDYISAFRNNNKEEIFRIQRGRRRALSNLTFAECVDNKGAFLPQISDLLWLISEETYWGSPTQLLVHNTSDSPLPEKDENFIDLYISETAKDLALTSYFLSEQLDSYHPEIRIRVHEELKNRVNDRMSITLKRYSEKFRNGEKKPNNWFPWISKNLFLTQLLSDKYENSKLNLTFDSLILSDLFYSSINADGSLEEGAVYWQAGFGKLYDVLRIIDALSINDSAIVNLPKIKKSSEFIAALHIVDGFYASYSDSDSKPVLNPMRILDMANVFASNSLSGLSAELFSKTQLPLSTGQFDVFDKRLYEIFINDNPGVVIKQNNVVSPQFREKLWYPGLGYFKTAFNSEQDSIVVTSKVGSNFESHNHNDVGVFELFYNGLPIVVDPGRQAYDIQMFGSHRYSEKYWFNTSSYHNIATLNNIQQESGESFFGVVNYVKFNDSDSILDVDLQNAFPLENVIYNRNLRITEGSEVYLTESLNTPLDYELSLITGVGFDDLNLDELGYVTFRKSDTCYALEYNSKVFTVSKTKLELDKLMKLNWERGLVKLKFSQIRSGGEDKFTFKFSPCSLN